MLRLPPPGLYGILDSSWIPSRHLTKAAQCLLDGGCRTLQLRMKENSDKERLHAQNQLTRQVTGLAGPVWVVINDRPDLCLILDRESPAHLRPMLHLGQDDMPPERARGLLGDAIPIGLSTHTLAQVNEADAQDVDYLGFGPVYPTSTKKAAGPPRGVPALADAVRQSRHPIVAIGGLTEATLPRVIQSGPRWAVLVSGLFQGVAWDNDASCRQLVDRVRRVHTFVAQREGVAA